MSLGRKTLTSLMYVGAEQYITVAVGFVTNILLTRLILPQYFGTLAMAWFFVGLFQTLKSFNLKAAIIQNKHANDDWLSTQFMLELLLGVLMLAISLPLYFLISHYYNVDVAFTMVLLMFFIFFDSFSLTPQAFLEKNIMFRKLALVNLTAKTVSSVASIIIAFAGYGLPSLIVLRGLPSILTAVILYIKGCWRPRLFFDRKIACSLLKFSSYLWLTQILMFVTLELDNFFVGTIAGLTALGFYSRAYIFARVPTNVFHEGIAKVLLPVYSQIHEDSQRLSRAFNMVVGSMVRVLTLVSALMVVSAPELTVLLFGETWLPLVRILRLLMIYLLLKPIVEHANVAFISLGKASITTKLLLVQAAILVILVPLFTFFYGTDGAALGVDIMVLVGFVLSYRRLSEFISFNYKSVFLPPLIGLVLSILVLYALLSIVRVENLFASIAIKSIVLSSVYISSLLLLERERILRMLKYSASLLFRRDVQ